MRIEVNKSLTAPNDKAAAKIRAELIEKEIFCVNIVSAPGSGKTSLIEKTIEHLDKKLKIAVIEGDPHTDLDSGRVEKLGATAAQINTQGGCHLDAAMVRKALDAMDTSRIDLLFIENVGNLLCPTFWDLGEHLRVVVASLPEGADKPLKYPETYSLSHTLIINKIDLGPLMKTTTEDITRNAHLINSSLQVLPVSCETGEGVQEWCDWLLTRRNSLLG